MRNLIVWIEKWIFTRTSTFTYFLKVSRSSAKDRETDQSACFFTIGHRPIVVRFRNGQRCQRKVLKFQIFGVETLIVI